MCIFIIFDSHNTDIDDDHVQKGDAQDDHVNVEQDKDVVDDGGDYENKQLIIQSDIQERYDAIIDKDQSNIPVVYDPTCIDNSDGHTEKLKHDVELINSQFSDIEYGIENVCGQKYGEPEYNIINQDQLEDQLEDELEDQLENQYSNTDVQPPLIITKEKHPNESIDSVTDGITISPDTNLDDTTMEIAKDEISNSVTEGNLLDDAIISKREDFSFTANTSQSIVSTNVTSDAQEPSAEQVCATQQTTTADMVNTVDYDISNDTHSRDSQSIETSSWTQEEFIHLIKNDLELQHDMDELMSTDHPTEVLLKHCFSKSQRGGYIDLVTLGYVSTVLGIIYIMVHLLTYIVYDLRMLLKHQYQRDVIQNEEQATQFTDAVVSFLILSV